MCGIYFDKIVCKILIKGGLETVLTDDWSEKLVAGHKFAIAGFDSGVTAEIESALNAAGGSVLPSNFTGVADYAVVPLQTMGTNITAVEVVTNLWLVSGRK